MIRTTIFDLDMASSKPLIISVKSSTIYIPFTMDSIIALTYATKDTNVHELYGHEYEHLNIYAFPITEIPNNWYGDVIRCKWLTGPLYPHLDYYLMIQKNPLKEEREIDKYLSIPDFV